MPSQQEVRWSQLKVGVVVLVSSVFLVTLAVSDDKLVGPGHLYAQADGYHVL